MEEVLQAASTGGGVPEGVRVRELDPPELLLAEPIGPRASQRGLHLLHPPLLAVTWGFRVVLVSNRKELEGLDPKVHAVRISGKVGRKKAREICEAASQMVLRVLNPPE